MDIPGRILAVDPGTKRIGYAISDDLQLMARPLAVWKRQGLDQDLFHLDTLIEQYEVTEVLVGMPYRMDGSDSPSTERARSLVASMCEYWPHMKVSTRDETLTTWDAEARLREEGIPPSMWKTKVDAYAAALLLEEELAERGRNSSCGPTVTGE